MADQEQEFVFVEDKINFFENLASKDQNSNGKNNDEVTIGIINNHFEKLSKFAEDKKYKDIIEHNIVALSATLHHANLEPKWKKYKHHSCKTMAELNELIDDIVANWGKEDCVESLEVLLDEYQFGAVIHDLRLAYKVALLLYYKCDHNKPNLRFDSIRNQMCEAYPSREFIYDVSKCKNFNTFYWNRGNKLTREMLVAIPGEWRK